jgi:guanylate kinase
MPPSMKVLEERLKKRATDDDREIEKRLEIAKEEMALVNQYDYVVINDRVDEAVDKIKVIIGKKHEK